MNFDTDLVINVRFEHLILLHEKTFVAKVENALQSKYGGYRGISGISSRRKIDGRDFLLVIHEGWIISFRRDVHFRISLT